MRKAVYAALMGLVFLLTLTAWGQTGPGSGGNSGGGGAMPTFTISLNPATFQFLQRQSGQTTLTLISVREESSPGTP
jgi:hypothetical protein